MHLKNIMYVLRTYVPGTGLGVGIQQTNTPAFIRAIHIVCEIAISAKQAIKQGGEVRILQGRGWGGLNLQRRWPGKAFLTRQSS